jgi:eukaryotic-like serine/threonine-protein kinase
MNLPRQGDRISNYLLEDLIGTGSFGQVWRATHHVFDDTVAIKIPTDADYVQNLRREGVVIHGLRHPNVVRAIDLDPYADPPYLIMEFVPGDSLRSVIDHHGDRMPVDTACKIMRGVLGGLVVAHEAGIVHRDLKPANILLTVSKNAMPSATEQTVKIADFGLGRICGLTHNSIMQSGSLLDDQGRNVSGTIAYMSPEQREAGEIDCRSDLYSCGIVLFEMLTGVRPHGAELPSHLRKDIPRSLDDVFARCYVRKDRRFNNAGEMLQALTGAMGHHPPSHRPAGPIPVSPPASRESIPGRTCPACTQSVGSEDQFCIHCGEQLAPAVPRCGRCDAYVRASDRFCISCGKNLSVIA